MEQAAIDIFKTFLNPYYPELKSLATSFLTLETTILVFSITFAEKIILPNERTKKYNVFLFAAWFMFLTSIIMGGYGLWRLFAAYSIANNWYYLCFNQGNSMDVQHFKSIYYIAYRYLNYSGIVFVFGILLLVISGLLRLLLMKKLDNDIALNKIWFGLQTVVLQPSNVANA